VQRFKKLWIVLLITGLTLSVVPTPSLEPQSALAFTSQVLTRGSQGNDVYELQGRLHYVRYYNGPIDGTFGWQTYWAVRNFQRDVGLKVDGTVGPNTKWQLVKRSKGYRTGMYQTASARQRSARISGGHSPHRWNVLGVRAASQRTPKPTYGIGSYSGKLSPYDINLLEHTVYSEARGEPFLGQVAVAACVLNRLTSPLFPHSIAGIVFQPGAFSSVADGQFWLTPDESAHRAVMYAIQGWDPSGGALYYFNPATATSKWIWSRPQIKKIGKHIFTR
jgi:N-acetylmuramoyl-L-alanine amidase